MAVVVLDVVLEASTAAEKNDVIPAARNDAVAESCTMVEVFVTVVLSVADFAGVGAVFVDVDLTMMISSV